MNQGPWVVTSLPGGVYRFRNTTGKAAVAIFFSPRGVDLDTGEPGTGVSQRVEPEGHFDIKMTRRPGATDPVGVKMEWRYPDGDGYPLAYWGYIIQPTS